MWGGKAEGGAGRRFIDAVGAGTGASQALANGWRRGAATGSEAEGVEPLTALERVYAAGGGGGPAGSQSAAKHRRRRWLVWRLRGVLFRLPGWSGPPASQGRHSRGGGAGCHDAVTALIASRNAVKHPSEGVNPRLRAPDPPPTNSSHSKQPRRRRISLLSRITY